jgi:hypothetical protein
MNADSPCCQQPPICRFLDRRLPTNHRYFMRKTIRNLDPEAYRALKARAARSGRTVGGLISEAIQTYLAAPDPFAKRGSLQDVTPEDAGPGWEHLSDDIDAIVYGTP